MILNAKNDISAMNKIFSKNEKSFLLKNAIKVRVMNIPHVIEAEINIKFWSP